jgi:hypothetical protein
VQRWHKNIFIIFSHDTRWVSQGKKEEKSNKKSKHLCGGKIQLLTCPSDTIKNFCITVKELG